MAAIMRQEYILVNYISKNIEYMSYARFRLPHDRMAHPIAARSALFAAADNSMREKRCRPRRPRLCLAKTRAEYPHPVSSTPPLERHFDSIKTKSALTGSG
jgi:hypothetical protein